MRSINLFLFSVINLLFIVAIQLVTLAKIGPSIHTDALFAGMAIPSIILAVIVGSLTNVLVPIFVHSLNAKHTLWEQIYLFFFGSLAIVLFLIATNGYWLQYIFSGFDFNTLKLTSEIIVIQLAIIPLSIASSIITAFFNAQSKFIWAELIPALCSMVIFPFIFYTIPLYGVLAVSYLYAAKVILTFLIQLTMIGFPVKIDIKQTDFRGTFNKIKYLLLGSIYYKSGPVIDRHILTHSTSGTLSFFVLVQQLLSMGNLILTKVIVIPQITVMNNLIKEDERKLREWLKFKIIILSALVVLLFLTFLCLGKSILSVTFNFVGFNKFDPNVIWLFTMALFGTFAGDFIATLISSAFYSKGDTRTPSILSILTYTIFIPLKFISFYFSGPLGLAVISSVYSLVNMFFLLVILMVRLK